jgi:hypothetical protein
MKTLDDARAEARDKHRFASPYRVGIQVALLGVRCANPYPEGSRGWCLFENGLEYGRRRAALSPTPIADSLEQDHDAGKWPPAPGIYRVERPIDLSPTPSVVKQSLTATQTGEKGEKDA